MAPFSYATTALFNQNGLYNTETNTTPPQMETINKLLKKQAPKTNSRRNAFNGTGGADASPDGESPKPNPIFVRWVSNKDGNRIGVPDEWLEAPVGAIFTGAEGLKSGKLIEEVQ
jgi:Ino eighty subunit 2